MDTQWIPTYSGLPQPFIPVLVIHKGKIHIGEILRRHASGIGDRWYLDNGYEVKIQAVTHWTPLPEMPYPQDENNVAYNAGYAYASGYHD